MFGSGNKPPKATDLFVATFDDGSKVTIWADPTGMVLIGIGIGIVLAKNFQRRK
jgi:hypothetical protein